MACSTKALQHALMENCCCFLFSQAVMQLNLSKKIIGVLIKKNCIFHCFEPLILNKEIQKWLVRKKKQNLVPCAA